MKKSRFSESQIISILNKQEQGLKIRDICREHGISDATFDTTLAMQIRSILMTNYSRPKQ